MNNLRKKLVVLMAAMFATLLGSSTVANSQWQTEEYDHPGWGYISCLSEFTIFWTYITIRFREFETPSGTSHYIEYWTWDTYWKGLDSGRDWIGSGHSPGGTHIARGGVSQWTSFELVTPIVDGVVGDYPEFMYTQRFKVTFDANGDLKVLVEPPEDLDDWIRCLGPAD